MEISKTPVGKFLLRIGVGVNKRIMAAKDKEEHQKNQKQRGMEGIMLPK